MRKIVFLLILFVFSCGTNNKYLITSKGIGNACIGSTYSNFISQIPHSSIKEICHNMVLFDEKKKKIIEIGDNDWGKSKVVRSIHIFSNKYHTTNGIYAGMTINELTNLLKTPIKIKSGYESIYPEFFQTKSLDGSGITFSIELKIDLIPYYMNRIGLYKEDRNFLEEKFETTNIGTNGYVSSIEITEYSAKVLNENYFFIFGLLDEYLGHYYIENNDIFERFNLNEQGNTVIFEHAANELLKSEKLNSDLRKTNDGGIVFYSDNLIQLINRNYNFSHLSYGVKNNGELVGNFVGKLKKEIIDHTSNDEKIAFLAGAYLRYGKGNNFYFANSYSKVKIISKYLTDLGFPNVKIILNNDEGKLHVPSQFRVTFEINNKILFNKITKYYEKYLQIMM